MRMCKLSRMSAGRGCMIILWQSSHIRNLREALDRHTWLKTILPCSCLTGSKDLWSQLYYSVHGGILSSPYGVRFAFALAVHQFNCQPELFCVKFLLSCLCHKADEIWEVNRCTMSHISCLSLVLQFRLVSSQGAEESAISTALWASVIPALTFAFTCCALDFS